MVVLFQNKLGFAKGSKFFLIGHGKKKKVNHRNLEISNIGKIKIQIFL